MILTDLNIESRSFQNEGIIHCFQTDPRYMAPELILPKVCTKAADWWTFGTILFEWLHGYAIFEGNDEDTIHRNVLNAPIGVDTFSCSDGDDYVQPIVFVLSLSKSMKSLLISLFDRDPKGRMAFLDRTDSLRRHECFNNVNWDKLLKRELDPPCFRSMRIKSETRECSMVSLPSSCVGGIGSFGCGVNVLQRKDVVSLAIENLTKGLSDGGFSFTPSLSIIDDDDQKQMRMKSLSLNGMDQRMPIINESVQMIEDTPGQRIIPQHEDIRRYKTEEDNEQTMMDTMGNIVTNGKIVEQIRQFVGERDGEEEEDELENDVNIIDIEAPGMSPCKLEFRRFLDHSVPDGWDKYSERFIEKGRNDIRYISLFDRLYLKKQIGMDDMDIELLSKRIEGFKEDHMRFHGLLEESGMAVVYESVLAQHGITSFWSFGHRIRRVEDLISIVDDKENAQKLWNAIQSGFQEEGQ